MNKFKIIAIFIFIFAGLALFTFAGTEDLGLDEVEIDQEEIVTDDVVENTTGETEEVPSLEPVTSVQRSIITTPTNQPVPTPTPTPTPVPVDAVKPDIDLLGNDVVLVEQNTTFTMVSFKATDNVDGDITSKVSYDTSSVDMTTRGTYYIYLNVTDAAGNKADEKMVTVKVLKDITIGENEVVEISAKFKNSNVFEMGTKKSLVKDELIVMVTENDGTTYELNEKEFKISSYSNTLKNNVNTGNKNLIVKLKSNTNIKTSVDYVIERVEFDITVNQVLNGKTTLLGTCNDIRLGESISNNCTLINNDYSKEGYTFVWKYNGNVVTDLSTLVVTENNELVIEYTPISLNHELTLKISDTFNILGFPVPSDSNEDYLLIDTADVNQLVFKKFKILITYTDGSTASKFSILASDVKPYNPYYAFTIDSSKTIEKIEFTAAIGLKIYNYKFTFDGTNFNCYEK